MRQSDDLFRLVKSMSKSEKRYFKLFASMQGKNKKYLLLFDAIDRQGVYNESALKEEFKQEKFVRQLAVTKGYLYNLVLKSLRLYRNGVSVSARLREMQSNIEVLNEKGLTDLALKVLDKAKELAERHEKFATLIGLLDWERSLRPEFRRSLAEINKAERAEQEVMGKLKNYVEYTFLLHRVANTVLQDHLRTPEDMEHLEILKNDPLLQHLENAQSTRAEYSFHWINATYFYGHNQFSTALDHALKMVEVLERDQNQLYDDIDLYLLSLGNCLTLQRQAGLEDEFWKTVAKIRSIAEGSVDLPQIKGQRLSARVFGTIHLYLSALYISRAEYRKCLDLIPEVETGFAKYSEQVSDNFRHKIYYNIAHAFFALEEYEQAIEYVNKILLEPEPYQGRQTYYAARLFSLILHYELGNVQLLESLVVSTHRYLQTRESAFQLETEVIQFFKELPRRTSRAELNDAFVVLRNRMAELEVDPLEQNAFRYFAYVQWLDSKIQNRPFVDVARERLKQHEVIDLEKAA